MSALTARPAFPRAWQGKDLIENKWGFGTEQQRGHAGGQSGGRLEGSRCKPLLPVFIALMSYPFQMSLDEKSQVKLTV